MGKINKFKKNGTVVYPVTVADAVVVSGTTEVQSLANALNSACFFETVSSVSDPVTGGSSDSASSAELEALKARVAQLESGNFTTIGVQMTAE